MEKFSPNVSMCMIIQIRVYSSLFLERVLQTQQFLIFRRHSLLRINISNQ
jgi:hypothetical protein